MKELFLPLMRSKSVGSFSDDWENVEDEDKMILATMNEGSVVSDGPDSNTTGDVLLSPDGWDNSLDLLDGSPGEEDLLLDYALDHESHFEVPDSWQVDDASSQFNQASPSHSTLGTAATAGANAYAPVAPPREVFRQVQSESAMMPEMKAPIAGNPTVITLDSQSDHDMTGVSSNHPNPSNHSNKPPTLPVVGPDSSQMESIHRLVLFMQRNESERLLVRDVEDIVRESVYHHRQGERKYQNLPAAILEKLIGRLGGDRLAKIYQEALNMSQTSIRDKSNTPRNYWHIGLPRDEQPALPCDDGVPTALQLGIAFGVHLARLHPSAVTISNGGPHGGDADTNDGAQSPLVMDYVIRGEQQVCAMSEQERRMFWNYVTTSGHYYV